MDARREGQQAPVLAVLRHLARDARAPVLELDADHQTRGADVADDARQRGVELVERRPRLGAARRDVVEHALLGEDVERRDGRRARDGVAAVGAAHAALELRRRDVGARHDGRERVAAREALGRDEDVRRRGRARALRGVHEARAPDAALDLVRDVQRAVVVAEPAHGPQEVRRRGHVAALAEHGLDQDRRDLRRRDLLLHEQVELREREVVADPAVRVGVRREEGPKKKRVAKAGSGDAGRTDP